jgi:hypothetical protein
VKRPGDLVSIVLALLLLGGVAFGGYSSGVPTAFTGVATSFTVGVVTLTGGTDTRVLFDDGGALAEDAGMTYNKTTDSLTLAGKATALSVRATPVAVGSLATCNAGNEGARASVTDSNAASYTAGIGAVVAAGAATHVPVYCDGTNWLMG